MPSFEDFLKQEDVQQRASSFESFLDQEREQLGDSRLRRAVSLLLDVAEVQHSAWVDWCQLHGLEEGYEQEFLAENNRHRAQAINVLRHGVRRASTQGDERFITFLDAHATWAGGTPSKEQLRHSSLDGILQVYGYAQIEGLVESPSNPARVTV